MKIIKLTNEHIHLLEKFCNECKAAGFKNNSSLELMKWNGDPDLSSPPSFWGVVIHNELVSVSGSHLFGYYSFDVPQIRCLFRSATLPKYKNLIPGLSKNHMNSAPFSLLLPYQILEGLESGLHHFYITTSNNDHDASGHMYKTHKAISILSKKRIVDFVSNEIIYSTSQSKWQIVLPNYYKALITFESQRKKLNIDSKFDYDRFYTLIKKLWPKSGSDVQLD